MLLDLKKLFENEEECIPFQFELDLSDTEISGVYPFVSPVQIRGSVQNTAQTVYMTAEADFDFSIPCDRCRGYSNTLSLFVQSSSCHGDE